MESKTETKKAYRVKLVYTSHVSEIVYANSEREAIEDALEQAEDHFFGKWEVNSVEEAK